MMERMLKNSHSLSETDKDELRANIVDGALNGNGQDYDSDSSYIVVYEDKDTSNNQPSPNEHTEHCFCITTNEKKQPPKQELSPALEGLMIDYCVTVEARLQAEREAMNGFYMFQEFNGDRSDWFEQKLATQQRAAELASLSAWSLASTVTQ